MTFLIKSILSSSFNESLHLILGSWVADEVGEILLETFLREVEEVVDVSPELFLGWLRGVVVNSDFVEIESLEDSDGGLISLIVLKLVGGTVELAKNVN